MKLGLILECPNQGTDHVVYEYVIKKICPDIDVIVIPSGTNNKPQMISNCGSIAQALLVSEKCDKVAILWDLIPTWGGKACRKTDIDLITKNLIDAGLDLKNIKLICIEPELEGWLIVEGKAITLYKTELWHPHPVQKFKGIRLAPQSGESKKEISRYLGYRYSDIIEAIRITKKIDSFDKIASKNQSFGRLKEFIDQLCTN